MFEQNFITINGVLIAERRTFNGKITSRCLRTVYDINVKEKDGYVHFRQIENKSIHCTIHSHEVGATTLYLRDQTVEKLQVITMSLVKRISQLGYRKFVNLLLSMKNDKQRIQFLVDASDY